MPELWMEVLFSLWVLTPAYLANMVPTIVNGKIPIDFGRKWRDGFPILGQGKTWEGLISGVVVGTLFGTGLAYMNPWIFSAYGIEFPELSLIAVFFLSFGALLGDIVGSFIKRRFHLPRGTDAPFLDQLDFLMGALVLGYWFIDISSAMIIIMFILTPIMHRITNIIGHWLKLKREPW
jgi:CDP-2,3-bis-(O-geranylgeranyl)-sn-glycerol synthase